MKTIISIDVDFLKELKSLIFSGVVHSVFKRTINIKCDLTDELYTIACKEVDNAPNTMIINIDSFQYQNIDIGQKVVIANEVLLIGDEFKISLANCNEWKCEFPLYPADEIRLNNNLQLVKSYIEKFGKAGGLKANLETQNIYEKEVSKLLTKHSVLLIESLQTGRLDEAIKNGNKLIGLGPGLTPSGDDFIVGIFTSIHAKGISKETENFITEIVENAKDSTNEISYMAIRKAAVKKVRESITSLVNSIFYRSEDDVLLSLKKVLNIGSTSGTDLVYGFVLGMETNNYILGGKQ